MNNEIKIMAEQTAHEIHESTLCYLFNDYSIVQVREFVCLMTNRLNSIVTDMEENCDE
ncbi:hypothetical protein [Providencia phage PSTRCR_127]|nr:hypothetical protein [Providencia phage PSTRCR_127]QQV89042.1 hypothetical protein [Providencia phage PSTRCR_121]UGO50215.1 hypothetical protein RGZ1_198 [Morganella phage vB_MmoM_Rgz1]